MGRNDCKWPILGVNLEETEKLEMQMRKSKSGQTVEGICVISR